VSEVGEAALTCPKCGGDMHATQRNGVTIEQCRKCHGIFLDRGEFEQLMGREASFLGNGETLPGYTPGDSGRASRWKKRWRR
jgi:Zn-finger nucleic acid-binding protein